MAVINIKPKDVTLSLKVKLNVARHKKTQRELISLLEQAGLDNAIRTAIENQKSENNGR